MKKWFRKWLLITGISLLAGSALGTTIFLISCSSDKSNVPPITPQPPKPEEKVKNTIFKSSNSWDDNSKYSNIIADYYLDYFPVDKNDPASANLVKHIYTQNVNLWEVTYYTLPTLYNFLYNQQYNNDHLPVFFKNDANYTRSGLADIFYCNLENDNKFGDVTISEFIKNYYKEYSLIFNWNDSYWFKPDGSKMELKELLKINFEKGIVISGEQNTIKAPSLFFRKNSVDSPYIFNLPEGESDPIKYTDWVYRNSINDPNQYIKFTLTMKEYWKDGKYITDDPYTWEYTLYGNWINTRDWSYAFANYNYPAACSVEPIGWLANTIKQNEVYWKSEYKVAKESWTTKDKTLLVGRNPWDGYPNLPAPKDAVLNEFWLDRC